MQCHLLLLFLLTAFLLPIKMAPRRSESSESGDEPPAALFLLTPHLSAPLHFVCVNLICQPRPFLRLYFFQFPFAIIYLIVCYLRPPSLPVCPDEARCSDSTMRRRCLHESGREFFGRTESAALWVVGFLLNSLAQLLSGMSGIVCVCVCKKCASDRTICVSLPVLCWETKLQPGRR